MLSFLWLIMCCLVSNTQCWSSYSVQNFKLIGMHNFTFFHWQGKVMIDRHNLRFIKRMLASRMEIPSALPCQEVILHFMRKYSRWGWGAEQLTEATGKGHEKPHQPDVTEVGQECWLLITLLWGLITKSSGVWRKRGWKCWGALSNIWL